MKYVPEDPGELVTMHEHWMADNGVETAVFKECQDAIDFCSKQWGSPPRAVIGPKEKQ